MAWNGYMWVVGGKSFTGTDTTLIYSYDGINFYPCKGTVAFPLPTVIVLNVIWNGNVWLMFGADSASNDIRKYYSSYDGINWQQDASITLSGTSFGSYGSGLVSRNIIPYLPALQGQPYSPGTQTDWPALMIPSTIPMALDMIAEFIRNYETYVQNTGLWRV